MYIKKTCGYILGESSAEITTLKGLLDTFFPATTQSVIWKYWRAILDPKLCADCLSHHGKIFAMDEVPEFEPPLHDNCRCAILPMDTITPGGATKDEETVRISILRILGNCRITIFQIRSCGRWAGKTESRPSGMLQGKCIQEVFMTMMTGICPPRRGAFGMKRTSITMRGAATDIEFCILMTA